MKGKKFLAIILAIMMCSVTCFYAAAESDPAAVSEETETSEVADDEENELGLTGSEMKEIYAEIEKALQEEYLDVNGIKVEDFSIPTDDESWDLLLGFFYSKMFTEDISNDDAIINASSSLELSEENIVIMGIISSVFYDCLEKFDKAEDISEVINFTDSAVDKVKELITSNAFGDSSEAETETE